MPVSSACLALRAVNPVDSQAPRLPLRHVTMRPAALTSRVTGGAPVNALCDKFGDDLAVLAVPSNQFGHQTNENDAEFVNMLKHVRPGNGFEFKGEVFACSKVNGAQQVLCLCCAGVCGPSCLH
jgi:hypothetical protein